MEVTDVSVLNGCEVEASEFVNHNSDKQTPHFLFMAFRGATAAPSVPRCACGCRVGGGTGDF